MPTAKKRINLTVDQGLYGDLEKLRALRRAPSLSAIVIELAEEALEIQEDLYFAKIAEERHSERTIPHAVVWKKKKH